jgi:hypothetical protein
MLSEQELEAQRLSVSGSRQEIWEAAELKMKAHEIRRAFVADEIPIERECIAGFKQADAGCGCFCPHCKEVCGEDRNMV